MQTGLFDNIKIFIKKIDPKSWPAFIMFLIVLTAAGALNYVSMSPVVGEFGAVCIALFFGVGVLSWHIVASRTDDSKYQEDTAIAVKWINVILDGILLVLNLFRADLHLTHVGSLSLWDALAYCVIGISAASHVVGFLLWTDHDEKRKINREHERDLAEVFRREKKVEAATSGAEARLKAIKFAEDEEKRLRQQYADVPNPQLEQIIRNMKRIALREFQDLLQDVDIRVESQDLETTKPVLTYAKDIPQVDPNGQHKKTKDANFSTPH
jgi:hypothetical protein